MPNWFRALVTASALCLLSSGGCVEDPQSQGLCDELGLKLNLCNVEWDHACNEDALAATPAESERVGCEIRCLLGARCDDFQEIMPELAPIDESDPESEWTRPDPQAASSNDTEDCIEDCRGGGSSRNFRCDDGDTIPSDWVCDDTEDCADGSDEEGC